MWEVYYNVFSQIGDLGDFKHLAIFFIARSV
jgi:hypothetical protein